MDTVITDAVVNKQPPARAVQTAIERSEKVTRELRCLLAGIRGDEVESFPEPGEDSPAASLQSVLETGPLQLREAQEHQLQLIEEIHGLLL